MPKLSPLEWYQSLDDRMQSIVDEMLAEYEKLGVSRDVALETIQQLIDVTRKK